MPVFSNHFDMLLHNIEPKDERLEYAQDLPAQVRSYLEKHPELATVSPQSRLAGSYARHTAIKDIKDVDILLFVDSNYRWDLSVEDLLDKVFLTLKGLPQALDDEGEVTSRRRQRRSINVHLSKADFDLDIVPVIALEKPEDVLLIPDKEWGQWVNTQPIGYANELSELNQEHGNKVVRLIKLIKHWRDIQFGQLKPKSYWLEVLVYTHVSNGNVETENKGFAVLFRDLLAVIWDEFEFMLKHTNSVPVIKDPMLGGDITNWERKAFEQFMNRVEESLGWANKALDCTDSERDDAIELWQKLFGVDHFPFATDEEAKQLGESLLLSEAMGQVGVAGTTGNVVTGIGTRKHNPVPKNRNYGD